MGSATTHTEFSEVAECWGPLKLLDVKSSQVDNNTTGNTMQFNLKGLELSYTIKDKGMENTRKVTLMAKKRVKILDQDHFQFRIHIITELSKPEMWVLQAEDNDELEGWIDAIRRAYRPRWVEQSASRCWICERQFSCCRRQHHCRKCGVAICSSCCTTRVELPSYAYYTPVRICDKCASLAVSLNDELSSP